MDIRFSKLINIDELERKTSVTGNPKTFPESHEYYALNVFNDSMSVLFPTNHVSTGKVSNGEFRIVFESGENVVADELIIAINELNIYFYMHFIDSKVNKRLDIPENAKENFNKTDLFSKKYSVIIHEKLSRNIEIDDPYTKILNKILMYFRKMDFYTYFDYYYFEKNRWESIDGKTLTPNLSIQRAEYIQSLFDENDVTPYMVEKYVGFSANMLYKATQPQKSIPTPYLHAIALIFEMTKSEVNNFQSRLGVNLLTDDIPGKVFLDFIDRKDYRINEYVREVIQRVQSFNSTQRTDKTKYHLGSLFYEDDGLDRNYKNYTISDLKKLKKK